MSDGLLTYIEDKTGGRLGRNVVWHDPRNRDWPARGVLFGDNAKPVKKLWWTRDVFDQNGHSSCTFESAAGTIYTSPFRLELPRTNLTKYDSQEERLLGYREAQKHDPYEGVNYDGSSTDAPFIVLRNRGEIEEWRWNFGIDDVVLTLGHWGAISQGTWWTSGMDEPDKYGFVKPVGTKRGGHAYRGVGVDPFRGYITYVNSWGRRYGINGRFRMLIEDVEKLLREDGEAVTVVL